MAAVPTVLVEIEFVSGVWSDVTSYVDADTGATITRGRASQSDDGQPGTLSVVFRNDDGRFTPDNPLGAYYPNVKKDKRIRYTVGGSVRFVGWINGFSPRLPDGNAQGDPTVSVTALDALGVMARSQAPDFNTLATIGYAPSAFFPFTEDAGTDLSMFPSSAPGDTTHLTSRTEKFTAVLGVDGVLAAPDGATSARVSATQTTSGSSWYGRDVSATAIYTRSVSFWAKFPTGGTDTMGVVYSRDAFSGFPTAVGVRTDGTNVWGLAYAGSTPTVPLATDDKPHFYTATNDATTLRFYVDGVQVATLASVPPAGSGTDWICSFQFSGSGVNSSTVITYDVGAAAFWDRCLTAAEVQVLYVFGGGSFSDELTGAQTVGDRLTSITTALDLPVSASGGKSVGWQSTGSGKALDAIFLATRGDSRIVYDNAGTVTYRPTVNPATVAVTLDSEADLVGTPTWSLAGQDRAGVVSATSPRAGTATVYDSGAVAATSTSVATALARTIDLQAHATRTVSEGRDARLRISKASVDTTTATVTAATMQALTLGDRVRVGNLPSSTIGWTYQDGYLLGYTEKISSTAYVFDLDLGPADAPPVGTADDATRSRAMSGTGGMLLANAVSSSDTSLSVFTVPYVGVNGVNVLASPGGYETVSSSYDFSLYSGLFSFAHSTDYAHSGAKSGKAVTLAAGPNIGFMVGATTAPAGTPVLCFLWAYVPTGSGDVTIEGWDATKTVTTGSSSTGGLRDQWVPLVLQLTAPQLTYLKVTLSATSGHTAYFDDVYLGAASPALSTSAGAYPLDLDINGERVTVTSAPTSTQPQVLTVTRGVAPSVARAHPPGEFVDVWHGCRAGY